MQVFRTVLRQLIGVAALMGGASAIAAISVTDDAGNTVTINAPARRIISLAPHATELLYAAGAGPYLVGVSQHSDYPPQATQHPSVGGSAAADMERIITLKPDLIVVWSSGNSASQRARLREFGIPLYESEPRDFAAIAVSIENLAKLAGTTETGQLNADAFRRKLQALAGKYQQRPPVPTFYQIWSAPLMTLNDAHLVSQALQLCGGRNVFGHLPQLAPAVSLESVLQQNPEAIVSSDQQSFSNWRRFPQLTATQRNNLFAVDGSLLNRPGPRILEGAEVLCRHLEVARSRRASGKKAN